MSKLHFLPILALVGVSTAAYAWTTVPYSRNVQSETLTRTGPKGTREFAVTYTSSFDWQYEDYKKGGFPGTKENHCRWRFLSYKLTRVLTFKGSNSVLGRKEWTSEFPSRGDDPNFYKPDSTKVKCTEARNSHGNTGGAELNTRARWQSEITSDSSDVDRIMRETLR